MQLHKSYYHYYVKREVLSERVKLSFLPFNSEPKLKQKNRGAKIYKNPKFREEKCEKIETFIEFKDLELELSS